MTGLLVDTDVLVDHLRGVRAFERPAGATLHCSVVTRAELFAGPKDQEEEVRELLEAFREIAVTLELAEAAGRIRRATGIGLPDALIAASALANGLELVTRNLRDFGRVDGLVLTGTG